MGAAFPGLPGQAAEWLDRRQDAGGGGHPAAVVGDHFKRRTNFSKFFFSFFVVYKFRKFTLFREEAKSDDVCSPSSGERMAGISYHPSNEHLASNKC